MTRSCRVCVPPHSGHETRTNFGLHSTCLSALGRVKESPLFRRRAPARQNFHRGEVPEGTTLNQW
jgi:hypothetical protein